ncbi:MAG: hypothetical protein WCK01_00420 [Candidatus Uhrbacteria bacterium]
MSWLDAMRYFAAGHERVLAARTIGHDRSALTTALRQDDATFVEEMTRRSRGNHVRVGTTEEGHAYAYQLPLSNFRGDVTGDPGSGKTRLVGLTVAHVALLVLERQAELGDGVIVVDPKQELASLVLRALAAHLGRLPRHARRAQLRRLQIFRPFGRRTRSFGLLSRIASVEPMTQAAVIVEALESLTRGGLQLGVRQDPALRALLALAISCGWSLVELRIALHEPMTIVEAAKGCPLPDVRIYFSTRWAREPRSVLDGVASRLDLLLSTASLKGVFSGAGPALDMKGALEGGVCIVDTSGAPLGAEGAARVLNAMAISTIGFAAFDPERRVSGTSLVVIDEVQVPAVVPSVASTLEALYSRGRSFGIAPLVIHQAASQLPTDLRLLLDSTVNARIVGQGSRAEMTAAAHWLPSTSLLPRTRGPGARPSPELELLSEAEEQRERVRAVASLGPRSFLMAGRGLGAARIVRSADFDPPPWHALDPDVLAELEEAAGVPVAEALARAREIEEAAAARILHNRPVASDRAREGSIGAIPDLPDALPRGGRRGGVP